MITINSTLSYERQTVPPIIPAVQGDTGRNVSFKISDYEIPEGAEAAFYIQKPSGAAIYNTAEIISSNQLLVPLDAQCLAEAGENFGQVRILDDGEVITSFDFILLVKPFRGIDAVESQTEMNIFDQAVEQAMEEIGTILDPTLKIQNKAAEAKATGDAINAAIEQIAAPHDPEDFYKRGDICSYDGVVYVCNIPENTIIQGDFFEYQWIATPLADVVMQNKVAFSDPNHDGHITIRIGS